MYVRRVHRSFAARLVPATPARLAPSRVGATAPHDRSVVERESDDGGGEPEPEQSPGRSSAATAAPGTRGTSFAPRYRAANMSTAGAIVPSRDRRRGDQALQERGTQAWGVLSAPAVYVIYDAHGGT